MKIRFLAVYAVAAFLPFAWASSESESGEYQHNGMHYGRCNAEIERCYFYDQQSTLTPPSLRVFRMDCFRDKYSIVVENAIRSDIRELAVIIYPEISPNNGTKYSLVKSERRSLWKLNTSLSAKQIINSRIEIFINATMIRNDCIIFECYWPQTMLRCHTPLMTYDRDEGRMNDKRKARVVVKRKQCSNGQNKMRVALDRPVNNTGPIRAEIRNQGTNALIANANLERTTNQNKTLASLNFYVSNSNILNNTMNQTVSTKVLLFMGNGTVPFYTCDSIQDVCKPEQTKMKCMRSDKYSCSSRRISISLGIDDECKYVINMIAPNSTTGYFSIGNNNKTIPIEITEKMQDFPKVIFSGSALVTLSPEDWARNLIVTFTQNGNNEKLNATMRVLNSKYKH